MCTLPSCTCVAHVLFACIHLRLFALLRGAAKDEPAKDKAKKKKSATAATAATARQKKGQLSGTKGKRAVVEEVEEEEEEEEGKAGGGGGGGGGAPGKRPRVYEELLPSEDEFQPSE